MQSLILDGISIVLPLCLILIGLVQPFHKYTQLNKSLPIVGLVCLPFLWITLRVQSSIFRREPKIEIYPSQIILSPFRSSSSVYRIYTSMVKRIFVKRIGVGRVILIEFRNPSDFLRRSTLCQPQEGKILAFVNYLVLALKGGKLEKCNTPEKGILKILEINHKMYGGHFSFLTKYYEPGLFEDLKKTLLKEGNNEKSNSP